MDIRTKLVFALVAVALGSMLALGWVMSSSAEGALRQSRLEQLDGLADAKKQGLEQIFRGWIDRVTLVASRPPLQETLREFNQTQDVEKAEALAGILRGAVRVVEVIQGLAIYDPQGRQVAAAGQGVNGSNPIENLSFAHPLADGIYYQGVFKSENGGKPGGVGFVAHLVDPEGTVLGDLLINLSAQGLLDVTEGEIGLGSSGETVVVALDPDGEPRVLHRSGNGNSQIWARVADSAADPVEMALAGHEGLYSQGTTDDRNVPVWAAVRFLPEPGWGLVLKVDAEEARAPIQAFRDQALRLTLSLGGFAILLGTLLGFQFSKPILKLVHAADQLRAGDFRARASVSGEDEVSLLAQTFNEMATELEERMSLLAEFQRYFQVSRDMLCIAGPDGYFKRVNPAFKRTLGWTDAQLLSRPFVDFVHPDDREKTLEEIRRLSDGLPTLSFENRYETPQGGYRILHWTAHPDPETGLVYATARDITERLQARDETRRELEALKAKLEEAQGEDGGPA